jgi:hypothetical protein
MMADIVGNATEITEITIRDAHMMEPEKEVKVISQAVMMAQNLYLRYSL